jgi:thiamine pyrophosphate-dependent acetolactate synthase large subunit-like protein
VLATAADRPLVLGGRGARGARVPMEALAERIGALLATSAPAHGLFAGNPWSVGISGGFASPRAQELLPQADLVLAFGASLNHWTTRRGELIGERVVRFDSDPAALGVPADAAAAATALAGALPARDGRRRWGLDALPEPGWPAPPPAAPGTVHPQALMQRLDALLPPERMLVTDAGHFQGYPPMHLSVPDGGSFVMTQSFQSVGLGLATGIGTAIARPDRITIAVVGDGGLMMALGELDAAAAAGAPLLIVVVDDGAYGAEVHHFGPMGEATGLVEFGQRDFAGVARALGVRAHVVRSIEDLSALGGWAEERSGPVLLDCKVDPGARADWLQEAFKGGA